METTPKHVWAPQNLAVFALFGLSGGAVVLGLPGLLWDASFAQWTAFLGAAFGGGFGVMIGLVLLRANRADVALLDHRRELGAWWMIAVGAVSSVVVVAVS